MTSLMRSAEGFFTASASTSPASASSSKLGSSPHPDRGASPLRSGAHDLHRDTSLKYARESTDSAAEERIRCSTCGEWVNLLDLGDHVCRPVQQQQHQPQARGYGGLSGSASVGSSLDRTGEVGRRRGQGEGLVVDTGAGAGSYGRADGGGGGQRSPRYPERHLDPSPHTSRGPSPARPHDNLVRSTSSQSTASAASSAPSASSTGARNLPFLDKYQKLAASTSQQTGLSGSAGASSGLTRSAGLADLSASGSGHGAGARTPSPNSAATPSPGWEQYNDVSPTTPTFACSRGPDGPPARPNLQSSRSQDATTYGSGRDGPSRGGWKDSRAAGNRREAIKASRSTPSSLASLARGGEYDARARGATAGGSRQRGGKDLDACMEDLRIMTEDDDHDGGAALLNEFFVERPQSKWAGPDDSHPTPKPPRLPFNTAPLKPNPAGLNPSPSLAALRANASQSARPRATPGRRPTNVPCSACSKMIDPASATLSGDQMPFCQACFNDRFLPRCRKCSEPITGGAVSSSDGKIAGKYHPACFVCVDCDAPFPSGEFYVWDAKPVCAVHYAKHNNSLCANPACGGPVEGACVSLMEEGGGRYHVEHFACSRAGCKIDLGEMHWVLNGLPWCERHAVTSPAPAARQLRNGSEDVSARARKRMTIVTRR